MNEPHQKRTLSVPLHRFVSCVSVITSRIRVLFLQRFHPCVVEPVPVIQKIPDVWFNGKICVTAPSSITLPDDKDRVFNQEFNGFTQRLAPEGVGTLYVTVFKNRLTLWWQTNEKPKSLHSFFLSGALVAEPSFDSCASPCCKGNDDCGESPLRDVSPVHTVAHRSGLATNYQLPQTQFGVTRLSGI